MERILFICTGNTCRSAMAEGFFNNAVKAEPQLSDLLTSYSAGIMAIDGDNASNNAILALKEGWNIDISMHKAKSIKYEYIKESNLILGMTKAHKDAVLKLFPDMESRVYTLKEYAANIIKAGLLTNSANDVLGRNNLTQSEEKDLLSKYSFDFDYDFDYDIPDPYGKPLEFYKYCAQDIKKAVDIIIESMHLKYRKD